VRTPSLVAQKVMDETDHHLLVGPGAQVFARNMGFTIEDDLNTERSRRAWLEWKRRTTPLHYLDPNRREAGLRASSAR
jgi:N4-(beta-N-acetylglucosaminyl)-L-asparaginase